MFTDEHKIKRLKFSNWVRTNFRQEDTMKILFSDEKLFDIGGRSCRSRYQRWYRKFSQKVMIWLGMCSKRFSSLVIFENGTVDHNEVLPVALKYENSIFGNDWTFHQDSVKPHTVMKKLRNGVSTVFLRSHWPPNNPVLNPLDYCFWDELEIKWTNEIE